MPPEHLLAAAVLRQLLHDAGSRRPAIREEAITFLADPEGLDFWSELLGIDTTVLGAYMYQALHQHGTSVPDTPWVGSPG